MSDYLVTDTELTSIANAIRTKGGTSANLSFPTGFVSAINAISGGLEYETGQWTMGVDSTNAHTESYKNTHSTGPAIIICFDVTQTNNSSGSSFIYQFGLDLLKLFGNSIYVYSDKVYKSITLYGNSYSTNSSINLINSWSTYDANYSKTKFTITPHPSGQFRAGRTYKWIAIWV